MQPEVGWTTGPEECRPAITAETSGWSSGLSVGRRWELVMHTDHDLDRLHGLLRRIDGRPYPAYRDIKGGWTLPGLRLRVDHVQGDPFAAPSRLRLRVADTGISAAIVQDPVRRMAAEDWLLRRLLSHLRSVDRGSGKSGQINILRPGPQVMKRSAVCLLQTEPGTVEVRFSAGLPARGRRILGRQALALLTEDIPRAAQSLSAVGGLAALHEHIDSVVVQQELRAALRAHKLVAFVADGAVLPRASGVDTCALPGAVAFTSPEALAVTLTTSAGPITGMGIPQGITVITGGGFHGKSTLLSALQTGHLDHVPGDGRERVVADVDTVKVRAEDGRRIEKVDVSAFFTDLPGGRSTRPLSTDDASGSTSQAAAIMEALESGAQVLLMDEDTCATNLMVRDLRMRQLIGEGEPITPLVERIQALHTQHAVSTVLVIGGVGDYLSVADTVILMKDWQAHEVTAAASKLAGSPPAAEREMLTPLARIPTPGSLQPTGKGRIRARDGRRIEYGREEIDLGAVEQLPTGARARSAGLALDLIARDIADGGRTIPELLDGLDAILKAEGLDALSPFVDPVGDIVEVRRHEVAACLNRLRSLSVSTP